jgi:hypothetical protein
MADITDPQAIYLSNHYVRPLCELFRAAKARGTDLETEWFCGLNTIIPNSADDVLIDGRADDGASRADGSPTSTTPSGSNPDGHPQPINTTVVGKPCIPPLDAS